MNIPQRRIHIRLDVEEITDKKLIKVLMDEFKTHPYIMSAEIRCGLFSKPIKRTFVVERQFDKVPQRVIVQQFEMRHLDKIGVRTMITDMENKIEELKLQLAGLEYGN